jgi:hypothetical protein
MNCKIAKEPCSNCGYCGKEKGINRPCELCGVRAAEHRHHLYSQTVSARKKYGRLLDDDRNIMYLCSVCHLNKAIPKMNEKEFKEKIST